PAYDADRSALCRLRRASGSRLQRRTGADGPALLHERTCVEIRRTLTGPFSPASGLDRAEWTRFIRARRFADRHFRKLFSCLHTPFLPSLHPKLKNARSKSPITALLVLTTMPGSGPKTGRKY